MSKEYVKIRLLTGDCLETAIEVAKQSGIISTYDLQKHGEENVAMTAETV